jgi:hypothetical protein
LINNFNQNNLEFFLNIENDNLNED